MSLTDQELLEGMRQGNLPSLDALLSRYGRPLLAFFYFLSWDRHGAEDSVQEVFRAIWNRRDSRQPIGVVKHELFRMALGLRPRTRMDRPEVGSDTQISWSHPFWSAYLQPPDWDEGPTGEWAEKVKTALDTLPEEDRTLLILTRYGGLDPDSTAEVCSLPVGDVREALHRSLDRMAKPLATGGDDLPPPCAEAPPGFPLPGEPVPLGEHVESCPSCGPRIEKHRDVWEHLADLEPPPLREGLWHELNKSLVSGMKLRISYPTGRLPRPLPEEVRIGKRTSRFWLRFTVVISVVIALITVYVGLVPEGEDAVPGVPPDSAASFDGMGGRERPACLPAMKPLPFSVLGGAPDPLGLTLSLRGFGSGTLTCAVYRVENPDVFLRQVEDLARPDIDDGTLGAALFGREGKGGDRSGPNLRFLEKKEVALLPTKPRSPRHQSVRFHVTQPGLYLFEAIRGDFVALSVKIVGTLNILYRRTGTSLLAVVSDGRDAPAGGARLRAFCGRAELRPAGTFGDGALFRDLPRGATVRLLAERGGDIAVALAAPLQAPRPSPSWILIEAPLARPGHRVRYLGFSPSSSAPLRLRVRSPEGAGREERPTPIGASGFFRGSIPLPPIRGEATLEVLGAGDDRVLASRTLAVDRWIGSFRATAGRSPVCRGEVAVFRLEGAGAGRAQTAYLPYAYRIRRREGRTVAPALLAGTGALDGEGKGEIRTPPLTEPGLYRLELGPTPEALSVASEVEVASNPLVARWEAADGFAEVGTPFEARFTLTDLEGKPVSGAEVRTFIEGTPFAMNTGKAGRTGVDGRIVSEILFQERGEAILTAHATAPNGFEARAMLRVPVSDGSFFGGTKPTLRLTRGPLGSRALIRGFGFPVLLASIDRAGAIRRISIRGEVVELPDPLPPGWLFANGMARGNPVQVGIPIPDADSVAGFVVETPASATSHGGGFPVTLSLHPGDRKGPPREFVVVASKATGAGPGAGGGSPSPLSVSGGSQDFSSFGLPRVGPFRFLRHEDAAPEEGRAFRELLAIVKKAGASSAELDRYRALPEKIAVIEMKDRQDPTGSPPPQGRVEPGPPEETPPPSSVRSPLRWTLGRTGEGGRGEVKVKTEATGTLHLTTLAGDGTRLGRAEASVTLKEGTGLELSTPPFLRRGDAAEARVVLRNRDQVPLKGFLHVGWVGDEENRKGLAVEVPPLKEGAWDVPLPSRQGGGRIQALFTAKDRTLEADRLVPEILPVSRREWWSNGVPGEKGVVSFPIPAGLAPKEAEADLVLARGTRDLLFQSLRWIADREVPDTCSLAGKLLALVTATRARGREEEGIRTLLADLESGARKALADATAHLTAKGGFARGAGGEEDAVATAALALAVGELGRLPGFDEVKSFSDVLERRSAELLRGSAGGETARAYLLLALASLSGPGKAADRVKGFFPLSRRGYFSPLTLARICLVLTWAGDRASAERIVEELRRSVTVRRGRLHFQRLEGPGRSEVDPVMAASATLEALAGHPSEDGLKAALLGFLLDRRIGLGWGSPFRTAHVARALAALGEPFEKTGPFAVELNGRLLKKKAWSEFGGTVSIRGGSFWPGENFLVLPNPGRKLTAWALRIHGAGPPVGEGDFSPVLSFHPLVKTGSTWRKAKEDAPFKRGAPLLVQLKFRAPHAVEEVLITVPVPAGLIPLPPDRLPLGEALLPRGASMKVEGDRVNVFLPHLKPGGVVLRFPALGGWSGTYTAPAAYVVSMARGLRASTPPLRITFR